MNPQELSRELREGNSCQIATLCSFASLALAMPEATTAFRALLGQNDGKA